MVSMNMSIKLLFTSCTCYGSETWSLILREEQKLRMFENKVVIKIFTLGPYISNLNEIGQLV